MQVTVQIPDHLLDSLIPAGSDPARTLLEESVAAAYRGRRIGPLQVSLLLGFETSVQTLEFLQKSDVWGYTTEAFDKDISEIL